MVHNGPGGCDRDVDFAIIHHVVYIIATEACRSVMTDYSHHVLVGSRSLMQ
jgi:hypothetical protein